MAGNVHGLGAEIVKVSDCHHDRPQRGRERERRRWSEVLFAGDGVEVHLGLEGLLYLAHAAGKANLVAAARHGIDREPLLLEPGLHLVQVGLSHAETGGELIGVEPLVIERRSGILLHGDESFKVGLLCG
jgi:hypothetical protein